MVMAAIERAVLWGADYPDVTEVGLESVGAHAAIALSYGGEPKHWPSKTPNEDAVAAVGGPRSTLLVVADGHEGVSRLRPGAEGLFERGKLAWSAGSVPLEEYPAGSAG